MEQVDVKPAMEKEQYIINIRPIVETPHISRFVITRAILYSLSALIFVSCSHQDKRCYLFAESWNSKCPITLVEGEATLTNVHNSKDEFMLSISLGDSAPISVLSLRKLIEEYSWRIHEVKDYYLNGKEIGGQPFVKGCVGQSPILSQIIDTIAHLTYTPESAQGYLPLNINISDNTDSIAYILDEMWEQPTEYECMNAIMPVEMCTWTSNVSPLPPLNDVVKVAGIPQISDDGILIIQLLTNQKCRINIIITDNNRYNMKHFHSLSPL